MSREEKADEEKGNWGGRINRISCMRKKLKKLLTACAADGSGSKRDDEKRDDFQEWRSRGERRGG